MLKSAGAKGGRPKKAAAADVVLQQPAAELPVKGAVLVRSPAEEQAERGAARMARSRSDLPRRRPRFSRRLDFPGNRERERRESSCQGKGRSSRVKGSRGDPFSLLFAALICLLQKHREIRACVSQRSTA